MICRLARFRGAVGPLVFAVLLAAGSMQCRGDEVMKAVVAADNRLGFDLYRRLAEKPGNLVLSPHGIATAMAMAMAGARGPTGKELAAALHINRPAGELADAHRALDAILSAAARDGGPVVRIADALHLMHGGDQIAPAYRTLLGERYGARIFEGSDLATLNDWVRHQTDGRIDHILTRLDPNSVCVLVSAIYFKGAWSSRFARSATHPEAFHLSSGEEIQVPTMHQNGNFRTVRAPGYDAIRLPYSRGGLGMIIVVPTGPGGLGAFEAGLAPQSAATLFEGLASASDRTVALSLPGFKVAAGSDLVAAFKALGVELAFDGDRADFAGMLPEAEDKYRIYISQIRHHAVAEVNEDGTEAAAGTAAEFATRSALPPPDVFKVDRPFLFLIADEPSNAILFIGRVTDPR